MKNTPKHLLLKLLIVLISLQCCKKDKPSVPIPLVPPPTTVVTTNTTYDIVIYGATSSGIMAAVQGKKMGKNVILISPERRIGGMTTGGLSSTDVGMPNTLGGLTDEFYRRIGRYYGQSNPVYAFEPKVALQVFYDMLSENTLSVLYNKRVALTDGIVMANGRIKTIVMETGEKISGKEFIDASYEGDLMKIAGVSYTIGRESKFQYGEPGAGIFYPRLVPGSIDPYTIKGDKSSGLLPGVSASLGGKIGDADKKVMGYCFRLCLTANPSNRTMIQKPDNYDPAEYEMLFRVMENKGAEDFIYNAPIPNGKFDMNSFGNIPSSDYVGKSYTYADADYNERQNIINAHENYEKGLIWTLQNDSRVPERIRRKYANLGLAADEFTDNNNWPTQLYIREGRRMVGDYVMTAKTVSGETTVKNPIALGSYNIDCHEVQYIVGSSGRTEVEGFYYFEVKRPYGISYKAIVPKVAECTNLFVPVCISASHLAFDSMRMEAQFMILGQSAATAASIAIDKNINVQDVDYQLLSSNLSKDNQRLN